MLRHTVIGGLGGRLGRATARLALCVLVGTPMAGCVTLAEHRKLERDVRELQLRSGPRSSGQVADLGARMDTLSGDLRILQGRLDEVEHLATRSLEEARAARETASQSQAAPAHSAGGYPGSPPRAAVRLPEEEPEAPGEEGATPEEIQAYRGAYAAWRGSDSISCIDRFRKFLQTFPASAYADDAAFWMADCYFKQGDFKTAILRFDDVVARYPEGNKAPDALYRQGESLLRLGPGYGKAAGKAFERVIREYPGSERATEAKRQLELLRSG